MLRLISSTISTYCCSYYYHHHSSCWFCLATAQIFIYIYKS